jgi:hypothetical protein
VGGRSEIAARRTDGHEGPVDLFQMRRPTTRMHLGPSCHDYPFSAELEDVAINAQIRGVLAPRVTQIMAPARSH